MALRRGIHERLITAGLRSELSGLEATEAAVERPLDAADAADRIAWHIGRQVERALLDVRPEQRVDVAVRVADALLRRLVDVAAGDPADIPVDPASVLHALLGRRPDGTPAVLATPLIPLLDTTLLTNAPGEPALMRQLESEVDSADDIDVVMAFIRRSGIQPLLPALRRHCQDGGRLRVLTTTFTDSTERAALDLLHELGSEIRVSYDTTSTRLHAKAWVFHRGSGWTTAYIGSSNLSRSAQVTGMEWNIRASNARNPGVIDKFAAVFDSYWSAGDFIDYDGAQFERERRVRDVAGPQIVLSPLEVRLHPFQERLLELVSLSRQQGHHRNLLVAATGTGKTVMAAVDYVRLAAGPAPARLLFIAHREEILDQSLATFRHVLRDPGFGEKWVGGNRPTRFEHVFASIQSLHAADLALLAPDHFDVVVLDEFHHAAAASYQRVLDHLHPQELLGLTATPERSDRLPILQWFGGRIAAELRVWDAIDRAVPGAVPVLRRARRSRSPPGALAARERLRRREAERGLHQLRRMGPAGPEAAGGPGHRVRHAGARLLRQR